METKVSQVVMATCQYITTLDEVKEVARYLTDLKEQYQEDLVLSIDTETYYLSAPVEGRAPRPIKVDGSYQGMIKTLQIGIDPEIDDRQFIIDIELIKNPKQIGFLLKEVLETTKVIGQNLKYDFQFLYAHLGIRLRNLACVMLMEQVLKAGDKHSNSLSSLYVRYFKKDKLALFRSLTKDYTDDGTGLTPAEYVGVKDKNQKSGWKGQLSLEQKMYARDDVRIMFYLYDLICEEIDEFSTRFPAPREEQSIVNAIQLEWKLIPIFGFMELRGIFFDVEHHRNVVLPFLADKMVEAEAEVKQYFTTEVKKSNGLRGKARQTWFVTECIKLTSHKQIKEALIRAGVPLPAEKSTAAETLEKFRNDHPALPGILKYKKASSLSSKFGEKLIICANCGTIYPDWFQIGDEGKMIDTGRSCCRNPNMQQIPNRDDMELRRWGTGDEFDAVEAKAVAATLFRKSIISRPKKRLVDGDYSQAEPRIQAHYTDEEAMIEAFNNEYEQMEATSNSKEYKIATKEEQAKMLSKLEVDTHAIVARDMFDLDEIPKKGGPQNALREVGKILNLGIGYGMGALKASIKIAEETKLPCSEETAQGYIKLYYDKLPGLKKSKASVERKCRKLAEAVESLAPFAGRIPFAVEYTLIGRPRRWCLEQSEKMNQESMALNEPHRLSKWYSGVGGNLFNRRLNKSSREAFNFIIQGTCADILKLALLKVQKEFDDRGCDPLEEGIIAVIHDEILCEVNEERTEEAVIFIRQAMIDAWDEVVFKVPIRIGISSGTNWAECH